MKTKTTFKVFIWASIFGAFFGIISSQLMINYYFNDLNSNYIKSYYDTETAVLVSPHHLRKDIMKGDSYLYNLVDLRLIEEYNEEHIISAINIPVQLTIDEKMELGFVEISDEDRIVEAFSKLVENGRETVIYCYSSACMTGRNVGKLLSDNGIFVKELGIGWNEWRYDWNSWNYPTEWNNTEWSDYVYSGSEPGVFEVNVFDFDNTSSTTCAIDNSLSC